MKRPRQVAIKGSSLPVLRIVVRDGDLPALRTQVVDTIEGARLLLAEAIAVLDFRERSATDVGAGEIVHAVRETGIRLAAVLIDERNDRAAFADLDLPVIEAPLSARERPGPGAVDEQAAAEGPETTAVEQSVAVTSANTATDQPSPLALAPAYLTRPLRSGQRFYAQGRDAVVAAPTSRGSELIADGSIYAFSPIRGRVLAGASGNTSACIVATQLDAELVAVAGVYRTFEADDMQALGSGPVSVALSVDPDGSERLTVETLAASPYIQRR
jgi:septum site-determining protein MinC